MTQLQQCFALRALGYCPYATALVGNRKLEFISYPFPEGDEIHIMARLKDDPTTMEQYKIPAEALDLIRD